MQGRLKREGKERQESMEEKDRQERMEEKDTGKVKFDITEYLKFVFPFQEADADKCFLHFEKVAGNVKWPTDSWVIQLQSVLVGKARKI